MDNPENTDPERGFEPDPYHGGVGQSMLALYIATHLAAHGTNP